MQCVGVTASTAAHRPSLIRLLLLRTAGRTAASTVPHGHSRRMARERERQLRNVVSNLSRDEMTAMQKLLRRRLQQDVLLEGNCGGVWMYSLLVEHGGGVRAVIVC